MKSPLPPRKAPKPEPTNGTRSFYGPNEVWARLEQIAAETRHGKSELVVHALREWFKVYDKSKKR